MKVLKQPAQLVPFSEMTRHFACVQTLPSLSTKSGKGPFPHFFFTEGRGRLYASYTTLKLDNCLKPEQKKISVTGRQNIYRRVSYLKFEFFFINNWLLLYRLHCRHGNLSAMIRILVPCWSGDLSDREYDSWKNIKQAEIYDNALMRKWYKITVYNKPSRIHNEIQQNYPGG